MFRYFVNNKTALGFQITKKDFHHIKNVVKLKIGEEIECVYNDEIFLCEIRDFNDDAVIAKELSAIKHKKIQTKKILIAGILKEQKWDYLLQKSTELGVDIIVPVVFKRNVVKIDKSKILNKIKRWQTICETAAMQSKRLNIPIIEEVIFDLNELVKYKCDLNLVAWENEKNVPLKNFLNDQFTSLSFVVGCEGGIESKEIEILNKIGFKNVSLGDNILRAETAPLYILSALIFCEK